MSGKVSICLVFIVFIQINLSSCIVGQELFLDHETKNLLDSLDNRIKSIQHLITGNSANRDVNYYYYRRDLEITTFLNQYYRAISDEDLEQAKEIIASYLNAAEKRRDDFSTEFYKNYQRKLTIEDSKQRAHYQYLFKSEKNFKNEFYKFFKENDEYSLNRCKRMTSLAIKYAREQNLDITLQYLNKYEGIINAEIYSHSSVFDVVKLTKSESSFQRVFAPMIASDSIEQIKKAGLMVENCYNYVASKVCTLDTNYFIKQRKIVENALNDYNERMGNKNKLSLLEGRTTNARFDTLNVEGIYKWNGNIVVVGLFTPKATFDNVKKGEAISDADHRLLEYIRVNRLAKLHKEVKMTGTYLMPYLVGDKIQDFRFDPETKKFQYMVCYTLIVNHSVTEKISKLLPPLKFETIEKYP
jgi:hypothetical protein